MKTVLQRQWLALSSVSSFEQIPLSTAQPVGPAFHLSIKQKSVVYLYWVQNAAVSSFGHL